MSHTLEGMIVGGNSLADQVLSAGDRHRLAAPLPGPWLAPSRPLQSYVWLSSIRVPMSRHLVKLVVALQKDKMVISSN